MLSKAQKQNRHNSRTHHSPPLFPFCRVFCVSPTYLWTTTGSSRRKCSPSRLCKSIRLAVTDRSSKHRRLPAHTSSHTPPNPKPSLQWQASTARRLWQRMTFITKFGVPFKSCQDSIKMLVFTNSEKVVHRATWKKFPAGRTCRQGLTSSTCSVLAPPSAVPVSCKTPVSAPHPAWTPRVWRPP